MKQIGLEINQIWVYGLFHFTRVMS